MSNPELETLHDFFVIHNKICVKLNKDNIDYTIMLKKDGDKIGTMLAFATEDNPYSKQNCCDDKFLQNVLDKEDFPPLFLEKMGQILCDTVSDKITVTQKSDFKEFLNHLPIKHFYFLLLEEDLIRENSLNNTSKKIKI